MKSNVKFLAIIVALTSTVSVYGHGYMASPRSRPLVAAEDGLWSGGDDLPEKENCPSCANTKNADGFCGKVQTRDYDNPKTGDGSPLGPLPQAVWSEGQYVEIDFVFTANHQGHHVTYACPDFDNPTQECFNRYKLEFVEDLTAATYGTTYNAPKDTSFPERAYVDPTAFQTRHRYKLPEGLYGDPTNDHLVLLQWHWLTGNSCLHEGYDEYNFPPGWSPDNMGLCPLPYSNTGVDVPPEQFWNCAEVKIVQNGSPITPNPTKSPSSTAKPSIAQVTSSPITSPVNNPVPSPVVTPTPNVSNGCCSQNYKTCDAVWCGNSKEECLSCGISGDKTWLPNGDHAATCVQRFGDCTNDANSCCDVGEGHASLECIGEQSFKQCMISSLISPTSAPVTTSPTNAPIESSPVQSTDSPTKSPTTIGTLFSTSNTISSYEALLELDALTYEVQSSNPKIWSLIAEGGAAGSGGSVVSEGQAYAVMVSGIVLASMDKDDMNRNDAIDRFYAYFNGWRRMCENSTSFSYCQSQQLCDNGSSVCLPGWKHSGDLSSVIGTGAAPDGDEDAILGMIMAVKAVENDDNLPSWYDEVRDWADASSTAFLLYNTELSVTEKNRILKLGTCWGGWELNGNNPSYHSPGSWRLMRDFQESFGNRSYSLPDIGGSNNYYEEWTKLIETAYKFLNVAQCSDTGLVPNWALTSELSDGSLVTYPGQFSGSGTPQYEFGSEASRTMWRILLDVALYPDEAFEQAEAFLRPLHTKLNDNFSNSNWSDNALETCDSVQSVFGDWRYNGFIFSPVYSTLVLEASGVSTSKQQEMIDAAGALVNSIDNSVTYYSRCWLVIGILTLNGDLAKAGIVATSNVSVTPAPASQAPTSSPNTMTPNPTKSPVSAPTSSCTHSETMSVRLGYFQSWAQWRLAGCDPVSISNVNPEGYTHLVYSFAKVGSDLLISPWNPSDVNEYVDFNNLKNAYPDLKTMIAIGGWTHNDPGELQSRFGQVSATTESREAFAKSVVTFLRQYGFDGLDLDWEYPAAPDRGGNPEDTENYVRLCEELRRQFSIAEEGFLLTMATPIGHYASNYNLIGLANYVDWFNIMSYDIHGYWDNPQVVGFQTDLREIEAYVAQYYDGVPGDKLVLGLASYGRTYTLSSVSCSSPGCSFSSGGGATSCTSSVGFIGYFEIQKLIENGQYDKNVFDEVSGSMYLSDGNLWISYDNAYTFSLKRGYAERECMRGVMEWAMDMSQGSNPLLDNPVNPPAPSVPTTPAPQAPTPIIGTCGDGVVGNGVCADISLCCSEWGWCGTTADHCGNSTPVPTRSPVSRSPRPTESPVTSITSSPTISPMSSPTKAPVVPEGGDACCSYDYKNCDPSGDSWCGANASQCSACSGTWLPNGPLTTCLAKWEPCLNSDFDCCGSTTCVGSRWWKQCK